MEAPRIRKSQNGLISAFFTVVGFITAIIGLLTGWPAMVIGLLLIILGVVTGKTNHICGACGNTVAATSTLCPTCRATLHEYHMSTGRFLVVVAWWTTIALIIVGAIWLIQNQRPQ